MSKRHLVIGHNASVQGDDALVLGKVLGDALDAIAAVAVVVHYPRHSGENGASAAAVDEFCEPVFSSACECLTGLKVLERPIVDESPGRALHKLAEDLNANLIVLGSASHGPAGQVLTGSVGESMLSGAPCAIAVAPRGYAESAPGLDLIGVGTDGSSQSFRALQAACTIAEATGATVRVLTVVRPHHYALGGVLSPLGPEEYEDFKRKESEAILERALEKIPAGIESEAVLLDGAPSEALAEAATELDLLALGSRAYGPLKGALLGSVSSKLVRSTPCAVLVLPRGSGVDPLDA